jgi:hypothetical protein
LAKDQSNAATGVAEERFYADGHPLDDVHFLEAKVILSGLRFTSAQSFRDFGKIVRKAAKEARIDFDSDGYETLRPQIREVLFLDTKEFKLYNNAFILRRRTFYEDGFPVGEPEIVFKFRHPDLDTASQLDVRPKVPGMFNIKFKEEWLPLKERVGGVRSLFSHNVEFKMDPLTFSGDLTTHETLIDAFPALRPLMATDNERLELVNRTAVEEVQQKLGKLDFGKGFKAESNVAAWRTRGDQHQLVGEFSFQCKFQRQEEVSAKAKLKCEEFFKLLQHQAQDWISLGTTKTGAVYRLKGNPPQSHE